MPRNPRLRARFFVQPDGVAIPKAPPLRVSERRAIYERDGGECWYCGERVAFGGRDFSPFASLSPGHVDHVFARARGGQNDPENLVLACYTCNLSKAAD